TRPCRLYSRFFTHRTVTTGWTTLNNLRYLHLIAGLAALLCGLYFSLPFFSRQGAIDLTAIAATLLGLANLQQFNVQPRKQSAVRNGLSLLGSALLLVSVLLPLTVLLITPPAGPLLTWAVAAAIAGGCLLTVLTLTTMLPLGSGRSRARADGPRAAGTVKRLNTTKGFGCSSRDQGEDVFVHVRAVRGEGHRVLEEGQRVEFVVARREKGLQAEDVQPLD